ncbi:unnamed protein product, partial [Allacma fusca]
CYGNLLLSGVIKEQQNITGVC